MDRRVEELVPGGGIVMIVVFVLERGFSRVREGVNEA
jgi:hypothetical protein